MTSNSPINPDHNALSDEQPTSVRPKSSAYRASVPIVVYRELAENLQNTQEQLEQVQKVNQELMTQNQQLRQEIIKMLQTAEQVQQTVKFLNPPQVSAPVQSIEKNQINTPPATSIKTAPQPLENELAMIYHGASEKITPTPPALTNLQTNPPTKKIKKKRSPLPKKPLESIYDEAELDTMAQGNGLNGWLLFLAILLIVLTAFGAGFIVMRPLLNPSSNQNPPQNPTPDQVQ
jgi:regulator of replication initiation timing